MVDAHVTSMLALGSPFRAECFDFGQQTITTKVQSQMSIILQHRSTPPPEATYSLHRKLSGCFLLCAKLGSVVSCARLLESMNITQQDAVQAISARNVTL
jgi:aarF domain-containing kinase